MLIKFSPNTSVPTVLSPVDIVTEWKFLGVIIDQYLSFNSMLCKKAQKRHFSRLQLKRMSVATKKLSMFYIAHIHSILTYCMPAVFPLLTKTQIESQENVQKLCTKMILPSSKCYYERLNVLSLPPLALFSENLYRTHFLKIMSDEHHQLHSFIPERQSACRRHSARLKDSILVRSRTTKRQNTFFMNGSTRFG